MMLPKTNDADTMDEFRPITLSNFKFKIITKIIIDRLVSFMPTLVSLEQRGFIQGRCIKDYICLASEAINHLDNKAFGGNLTLKVDIAKHFDTISWEFLLQVLRNFCFNKIFCK